MNTLETRGRYIRGADISVYTDTETASFDISVRYTNTAILILLFIQTIWEDQTYESKMTFAIKILLSIWCKTKDIKNG